MQHKEGNQITGGARQHAEGVPGMIDRLHRCLRWLGQHGLRGRLLAIAAASLIFATTHTARAGVNVWTSHGPPSVWVTVLVIDPKSPTTLYAATDSGLFKSTDGSRTWSASDAGLPTNVGPPQNAYYVSALAIDPVTPTTLYAGRNSDGIFKSTDGGSSWFEADMGLPFTGINTVTHAHASSACRRSLHGLDDAGVGLQ